MLIFAGELLSCIIHPPGLYLLGIIRKPITHQAAGLLGSTKQKTPGAQGLLLLWGFPNPVPAPESQRRGGMQDLGHLVALWCQMGPSQKDPQGHRRVPISAGLF